MARILRAFTVSNERKERIIQEITLGSEPRMSFYALLLTASLIASFGLISNSTAVVIGAMLVSPLMTPILGMALALVRGDGRLMGHAVRSEVVGVILAISVPAVLGILPLNVEATPEMLARTQPNLLDIFVALLAGFAGALATIDERISPALPGVAIATAIVPPLANCGLCLGLGAFGGAFGSFLLFFVNFLSILLINAFVYWWVGLAPAWKFKSLADFVLKFGPATLGFFLISVFMTNTLLDIVRSRIVNHRIKTTLELILQQYSEASMDNFISTIGGDSIEVLAMVRSARLISPDTVKKAEDALAENLGEKVHLVVRNSLAKDIGATGGVRYLTHPSLDGSLQNEDRDERLWILRNAEQTLLEILAVRADFQLKDIEYLQLPRGPVIFATLQGLRQPTVEEIQKVENALQQRLANDRINFIVRFIPGVLLDHSGEILYGWTDYSLFEKQGSTLFAKIRQAVNDVFRLEDAGFIPTGVHFNGSEKPLSVLVEVTGKGELTAEMRAGIEREIIEKSGQQLQLYLWPRAEMVWTPTGVTPIKDLLAGGWQRIEARLYEKAEHK